MLARRLIPCLAVAGGRVVKGVHFRGLRDAGDPAEQAARYDAEGADEIVFLDIAASHERSEEHTSELQSRLHLVCRLLLEKKKNKGVRTVAVHAAESSRSTHGV